MLSRTRNEHFLWVANVGLPGFSGEALVDLILSGEKKVKYLSGMKSCFNGQWIALREIRNHHNAALNGRCRCAIQLDEERITPRERPELFLPEWGWTEDHASSGDSSDEEEEKKAPWYAHLILQVKLLNPVYLEQSHQGKCWKLKVEEPYLPEAATLLHALANAVVNPTSQHLLVAGSRLVTREQTRLLTKKRKHHAREQERGMYFFRAENRQVVYTCCRRNCVVDYGCSLEQYDAGRSHAPLFVKMRQQFHSMNRVEQREVLRPRIVNRNARREIVSRHLYLENLVTIRDYMRQGTFKVVPAPGTLRRVCHRFFTWAFGISNNKIDQPTVLDQEFSVEMAGPRVKSVNDLGASEFIISWLKDYAEGHLHDPSADSVIILYVAKRAQVYAQYEKEFRAGERIRFFPLTADGELMLPSKSYFLRVWRTHPDLKKIVLRKFMKFALCSQCTRIREQKRNCVDAAQKEQLKAVANAHWTFVREERDSYYYRRHQAITAGEDYLSIIIDGADQAAYGLPHFIEKDKDSASAQKLPVYLMGALVHGLGCYAFSYINNVKHGTNIVIECLHRIFCHLLTIKSGRLPRVLFLQVDNTCKQNKNKYMIGYLACMVQWHLFSQVYMSFLPVGHTHEDVDQFFSKIAGHLRTNDAYDRNDIVNAAKDFHPHWAPNDFFCHTDHVENAANISTWLETKLSLFSCHVKSFQQYRIRRPDQACLREVIVQGRARCADLYGDEQRVWKSMDEVPGESTQVLEEEEEEKKIMKIIKTFSICQVFAHVPVPSQLRREVPDAQLARGSERNSDDEDSDDDQEAKQVPEKLTPEQEREVAHRKWVDTVCKGVRKVIDSARGGLAFEGRRQALQDLQKCIALLKSENPLPFHWNVSIYVGVEPPPYRRLAAVSGLGDDLEQEEDEGDEEEDDDEDALASCPPWLINNICVISTEAPPFWAIVK